MSQHYLTLDDLYHYHKLHRVPTARYDFVATKECEQINCIGCPFKHIRGTSTFTTCALRVNSAYTTQWGKAGSTPATNKLLQAMIDTYPELTI